MTNREGQGVASKDGRVVQDLAGPAAHRQIRAEQWQKRLRTQQHHLKIFQASVY